MNRYLCDGCKVKHVIRLWDNNFTCFKNGAALEKLEWPDDMKPEDICSWFIPKEVGE